MKPKLLLIPTIRFKLSMLIHKINIWLKYSKTERKILNELYNQVIDKTRKELMPPLKVK